jgi:hypothetical protein
LAIISMRCCRSYGHVSRPNRRAIPRAHEVPYAIAFEFAAQQKSLHASKRDTACVQAAHAVYPQRRAAIDCRRLKFVEVSGVTLPRIRLYGRALAAHM